MEPSRLNIRSNRIIQIHSIQLRQLTSRFLHQDSQAQDIQPAWRRSCFVGGRSGVCGTPYGAMERINNSQRHLSVQTDGKQLCGNQQTRTDEVTLL
jgi:hypothetical protein